MTDDNRLRQMLESLLSAICRKATTLQLDGSYAQEIGPIIDASSYDAPSAEDLLAQAFSPARRELLDFGCGAMHHRPFVESLGYRWRGVDYLGGVSPSVLNNVQGLGSDISFYDGRMLPYPSEEFDAIWALLVLQHVQHIDITFSELARVLRRGGKVIGQVSYLEQIQDYGTFNYTPYGMKVAAQRNGLTLTRIYPKHDAFSFLLRRLLITLGSSDDTPFNEHFNPDGFFHRKIIETGERIGMSVAEINLVRLMFCTHFVFELTKP
ncbi:MAG: class I SAM-dependent methyltransferase [Proteobacteria bacterium]|nr:class I SAM-dependent methyltransferase [Pseudomonadota bacterium]